MGACTEEEYYYKLDNMLLSSYQHLRKLFKDRWKSATGEEWVDDAEHLRTFVNGLGQTAYKKGLHFQKSALESKGVEEWDMTILSLVLQNFPSDQRSEQETRAIMNLRKMRNDLAHHCSNKIPESEFKEKVKIFRSSLQSLGIGEKEVCKLIQKAGSTCSVKALKLMQDLHRKAEALVSKSEFDKALEFYCDAIEIPSLLPANHATAYEKRAECLLAIGKSQQRVDQDNCRRAKLDIDSALELNDSSWTAHYLAGECQRRLNHLDKAISHYQRALAISPVQKQVKADLDSVKVLAGVHNRRDHLDPQLMPVNLQEWIKLLEVESGQKISKQEYLHAMKKIGGSLFKGQDHVFRGHQYSMGWDVSQDFTQAVKFYAKAASLKNAEGMYNLAQCYHYGHGVKQDMEEALRIYRELAEMDVRREGALTPLGCNVGVASAFQALGTLYQNGIGVETNNAEAAKWYKRAMESGVGGGANNLGNMYANGIGVGKDEKMAEMCWKQAINLKNHIAPGALMAYYLGQMEPEKARGMVRIGREMGNPNLQNLTDAEIEKVITCVEAVRLEMEPKVVEFERVHKLETKGLTFKQRVNRLEEFLDPDVAKLRKMCETTPTENMVEDDRGCGGDGQELTLEMVSALKEKAIQGSETAIKIAQTFRSYIELVEVLSLDVENSEKQKMEVLDRVYKFAILESDLVTIPATLNSKLKGMLADLFGERCKGKGEIDMKIRLCYVVFNLKESAISQDMLAVELLKEGVRRYPANISYYDKLLFHLARKEKFQEALSYAEQGLQRFPGNVELLYWRACLLAASVKLSESIAAFKEFLKVAPPDHKKVPEAYYQLCNNYLLTHKITNPNATASKELDQANVYFKRGQEAEKDQLPCYLPCKESSLKRDVRIILGLKKWSFQQQQSKCSPEPQGRPQSVLERKEYLKCPARKRIVLGHRENLNKTDGQLKSKSRVTVSTTVPPKLKQTAPKRMSAMTPITLTEMNPTQDHIFENRMLDLTIVDDPNPNFPSIHLIAEDENGDMIPLAVYNFEKSREIMDRFRAGCRIAISNPYVRVGGGAIGVTRAIRVDEPRCVAFLEKVENLCRFCGEEKANKKCSKCKRPYCSKECQTLDWKMFNHKLICNVKY